MLDYFVKVFFEPLGRMAEANPGESILDVALRCGVGIRSDCGGMRSCGKCRVIIGNQKGLTAPSSLETSLLTQEELANSFRLACAAKLLSSARKITVALPPESRQRVRRFAGRTVERRVKLEPVIMHMGMTHSGSILGLAVDIGTSRITVRLIDLSNGMTLSSDSIENPQIVHGENLITRAFHAQASEGNQLILRALLVDGVNLLIGRLVDRRERENILQTVIVGNTVMHHFFLGLDTNRLTRAPFTPMTKETVWLTGIESQLDVNPAGVVVILPNIDAFVGADAVADIISSNLLRRAEPTLLVDVGTNTEIMLRAGGETLTCSCASGPAFEGEHIEHGMKAVEGAIERIKISGNTVEYKTLGGGKPVGVCGSGIVDAVAELLRHGLITTVGRFTKNAASRVIQVGSQRKFVIAPRVESSTDSDITISERDINEVILAKAAIASATRVLMAMKSVEPVDLRRVLIAGAFGDLLDKANARAIGLIPPIDSRRILSLGNAALEGATMALKSRHIINLAERISKETRYVELASNPDFDAGFRKSLLLSGAKRY